MRAVTFRLPPRGSRRGGAVTEGVGAAASFLQFLEKNVSQKTVQVAQKSYFWQDKSLKIQKEVCKPAKIRYNERQNSIGVEPARKESEQIGRGF